MEKNMDNIKLYLRWMMSEPIGDTMLKGSTDKGNAQGVHGQRHDAQGVHGQRHTSPLQEA